MLPQKLVVSTAGLKKLPNMDQCNYEPLRAIERASSTKPNTLQRVETRIPSKEVEIRKKSIEID